jgi:4-amino-4-deoxy-L-arabinose transferase-like glycosyltransferase
MELTPTTERAGAGEMRSGRVRAATAAWPGALLVALAALLPRLIGLADFLTTDEAYHWITRTERFAAAAAAGRWADTILTGHPGVTLMWLGGLGLRAEEAAVALGLAAPPDRLGHLAWLRLGPALAHVAAIVAGHLLLRRLLRPAVALAAALLWASSPYLTAHGRLLHLDALLTDFVTLTLLAALVACRAARPLPWLALAGGAAGLALLTKGPALIVLPFVGLLLFALAPRGRAPSAPTASRALGWVAEGLGWALPRYLLWLGVALLTAFLLWPALWAAPEAAVGRYVAEIVGNGGRPNGDGQFFLGRADADPGPLFYPLAGLFRLTPLETLGLAALAIAASAALWARRPAPGRARQTDADQRATLLALAAFVLFWTAVMAIGPKKFDRYTLPTWPALLTLSAAGLGYAAGWLRARLPGRSRGARRPALALLLVAQAAVLAWYHPYYLSYYSPLLGGGPAAQRALLIGWGEGMDEAGAWLAARPDIGAGQVLSALPPTLQPFLPVPVQEVRAIDSVPANYAVVYLESLQRGDAPAIYARIAETLPLHTVRIHGIEYARIHQLARPYDTPLGARFAESLALRGFSARQEGSRLIVTPAWDVRGPIAADYMLFLHIFDAAGQRVGQIDVAPGGASLGPTSGWQPGQQIGVPLPVDLPPDLPPGDYALVLGLYTLPDFVRAPLSAGPAADPSVAGPDATLLGTVRLGE